MSMYEEKRKNVGYHRKCTGINRCERCHESGYISLTLWCFNYNFPVDDDGVCKEKEDKV